MAQRSIASFFGKPGAKAPTVPSKKVSESTVGTPSINLSNEEDKGETPITQPSTSKRNPQDPECAPRKRLRPMFESSDDDDSELPPKMDVEKVGDESRAKAEGGDKNKSVVEAPGPGVTKPARCQYGDGCFRKNPEHVAEFHPNKVAGGSKGDTNAQTAETPAEEFVETVVSDELVRNLDKYDPVKAASWKKGERVPYSHLAVVFAEIEKESKRLRITELLSNAFRSVIALTEEDLLPCVYLAVNKLSPAHEGVECGIGESILMKALCEATGRTLAHVKAEYQETGDLGTVAQNARSTQQTLFRPKPLTAVHVFQTLKSIALEQGNSAQNKKKDRIKGLLVAAQGAEATYIARALQGRLRIGVSEATVLVALAHAITLTPPAKVREQSTKSNLAEQLETAVAIMKSVHAEMPSYDAIVPNLLAKPIRDLPAACHLTPGVPVKPMLAHPTKGISEVLDRFANTTFTCEFKYDGERAQIHVLEDGSIKIFSRNSEDNTPKYPDLIQLMPKIMKPGIKSCILDSEVVAYDIEKGGILPFQVLSTRSRKAVEVGDVKVQVCLFVFDMLFLNGEPLLKQPFKVRREHLHSSLQEVEGRMYFAKAADASDTEQILAFLNESVAGNCEGLMVKTLEGESATYEPDKRSHKWLKVKKDYISGMTDSLDLVPIAGYLGKGKRTGVYGAFLLACYDQDTEEYQSICKIGTGFSEADLQKFTQFFKPHEIEAPRPYYSWTDNPNLRPDVWFEPCAVWEVACADLSISPVHKAASGKCDDCKGIALRFPRLLHVREDKNPEDATSADQVADFYRKQAINHGVAVSDEE